jgi:hypothetical protein
MEAEPLSQLSQGSTGLVARNERLTLCRHRLTTDLWHRTRKSIVTLGQVRQTTKAFPLVSVVRVKR